MKRNRSNLEKKINQFTDRKLVEDFDHKIPQSISEKMYRQMTVN